MPAEAIARLAFLTLLAAVPGSCNPPTGQERPQSSTEPVARPTTAPTTMPATQPVVDPPPNVPPRQTAWVRIEKLRPGAPGGWATGDFDVGRNKITIETRDVEGFAIHWRDMGLRWDRRVILRINRQSMELTPKESPIIQFRQNPTGAWEVISD